MELTYGGGGAFIMTSGEVQFLVAQCHVMANTLISGGPCGPQGTVCEVAVTSSGSRWLGRAVCTNSAPRHSANTRYGAQMRGGRICFLRAPQFPTEAGSGDRISQAVVIRGHPGPRIERGGVKMDDRNLHGDRNGGVWPALSHPEWRESPPGALRQRQTRWS